MRGVKEEGEGRIGKVGSEEREGTEEGSERGVGRWLGAEEGDREKGGARWWEGEQEVGGGGNWEGGVGAGEKVVGDGRRFEVMSMKNREEIGRLSVNDREKREMGGEWREYEDERDWHLSGGEGCGSGLEEQKSWEEVILFGGWRWEMGCSGLWSSGGPVWGLYGGESGTLLGHLVGGLSAGADGGSGGWFWEGGGGAVGEQQ
ncbi:hypothetical protein Tco_0364889 [Tanacetum coccineum]